MTIETLERGMERLTCTASTGTACDPVQALVYDRTRKASVYARAGIPEYWIVNLIEGQLEIHREPSASGYRSRSVLGPGETVSALPASVTLAVADLLP